MRTLDFFRNLLLPSLILLYSCSGMEESEYENLRIRNRKGEFIYRTAEEHAFENPSPLYRVRAKYPWEQSFIGKHPKITKEFFRCKGSSLNPVRVVQAEGKETQHYLDCGGKHSLPIRDGKEFVYPVLIELLNYLQAKTGKRVVITSGYRCPIHNSYVDASNSNQSSKHLVGAEVDFYVQGMESRPETIVKLIMLYYQEHPLLKTDKQYTEFKQYEKADTNVVTRPLLNKEIFIKVFKKSEGRNFDNRHPHSYISIQVRFDRDHNERVIYTWDQAFHNYLRW